MHKLNENGDTIDQSRDILLEIAKRTKKRIEDKKEYIPLQQIIRMANFKEKNTGFPFEKALKKDGVSFICEVKKASPSKGLIAPDFPYIQIAKDYEKSGASAISCLTEPFYFQGKDDYLTDITKNVSIPVLRKDFTVDEYMVYEAKVLGASAILLICAILDDKQLKSYFEIAQTLGLSAIFEAHTAEEVERAINCGARVIGVNNRNLKTFEVSIQTSLDLRKMVGEDVIFISESGIKTKEDILSLHDNNVDAVLIGETLMRAPNKKEVLDDLKSLCPVIHKTAIKICGVKKQETIEVLNEMKPDFVGFVFAKSTRQVGWRQVKNFKKQLDSDIKVVGVFVNEDVNKIIRLMKDGVFDVAQLHGQESEEMINMIKLHTGKQVIKAISVNSVFDILKYKNSIADYLLLDNGKGGSGKVFDWSILNELKEADFDKPFFIAGGLDSDNISDALEFSPFGVDVSGGVETDLNKDNNKIKNFINKVRQIDRKGSE
ncbi:MAG: indole-3-glycerol phosphate synthase TrpC [Clostridia bacterium]